ncbi:MAG: ECF transporter S component [Lachnospiraceae bacterium]|nr:ECF transporter S component [Lachnospiraceae bacterium]
MHTRDKRIKQLTFSAIFLAIAMVLPFFTGQIPQIGAMLSPMHIPVFLCGFVCGWPWGLAVGLVAPVLRSLIFGMPKLFPTALAMTFELAAYGAFSGLFYKILPKKNVLIYVSLVISMLSGRVVWGIAEWILLTITGAPFSMDMFIAGAFISALPGIILHIVLIPPLVMITKKAKLIET